MASQPFIILNTTESTNNHAMEALRSGNVADGTVFFALEQTKGKGQRSKSWFSNKGENLVLSTIRDTTALKIDNQFQISCITALACHDLISSYTDDDVRIKWPNDLYWRDRKAGGILIENMIKGNSWDKAIIGIGININQTIFPEMPKLPVSLKQITGTSFDPIELAKELCMNLDRRLHLLNTGQFEHQLLEYNATLYKKNEVVQFKKANRKFEATINGVNEQGQLILTHGIQETIDFGDLEWIL